MPPRLVLTLITLANFAFVGLIMFSLSTDAIYWHMLTLVPFAAVSAILEIVFVLQSDARQAREIEKGVPTVDPYREIRHSLRMMLYLHAILVADIYMAIAMMVTAAGIFRSRTRMHDCAIVVVWGFVMLAMKWVIEPRDVTYWAAIVSSIGMTSFAALSAPKIIAGLHSADPIPRPRPRTQRIQSSQEKTDER